MSCSVNFYQLQNSQNFSHKKNLYTRKKKEIQAKKLKRISIGKPASRL